MRAIAISFVVLLLSILALVEPAVAAGLPVLKKTLSHNSKAVVVSIAYPQTGNAAIDDVLRAYARKGFAENRAAQSDDAADDVVFRYETTYRIARNDGRVFSVLFNVSLDQGGIHPDWTVQSFNFLLPDGELVFLPEIMAGKRGFDRLSRYATADLTKRFTGEEGGSDVEWIQRGAAAEATDFETFVLRANALEIIFQPYQVAAHSEGAPSVVIPLRALKGALRESWQTRPSFDCGGRRSAVEQAICGDAVLSRFDRQMMGFYGAALASGANDETLAMLRKTQRDWLAKRNKACNVPNSAVCLRDLYAARLAILRKYAF